MAELEQIKQASDVYTITVTADIMSCNMSAVEKPYIQKLTM